MAYLIMGLDVKGKDNTYIMIPDNSITISIGVKMFFETIRFF